MSFSLLREPWIPLIRADGSRVNGSLADALLEPGQWAGIDSANPVECLALHRLLLAICHRAIGPGDSMQRGALLDAWPKEAIVSYLERWADRFHLFDPVRPFLQTPSLSEAGLSLRPWMVLVPDRSVGAMPVFWDHSLDGNPEPISPAAAALALVAHQQFTPGGLVRALRTSGSRGTACGLLLVIPTGQSLQQTLALSLVPQSTSAYQQDLPAWEQPAPLLEALRNPSEYVPVGPAQRYTHLSRAVLFQPGEAITHLLYGEGLVVVEAPTPDPMVAAIPGKNGPMPMVLRESRAMWRDFQALTCAEGSSPPETIRHAVEVCQARGQYDPINLLAGGLLTDKAKILLWRLERREVSPVLLAQGNAIAVAQAAVERAERSGQELNKALWVLCSNWLTRSGVAPDPDKKAVAALRESIQAMPRFWAALEPAFWSLVHQLGEGIDHDEVLLSWTGILKSTARSTWEQGCDALGRDGRGLAAAARSGSALGRALAAAA